MKNLIKIAFLLLATALAGAELVPQKFAEGRGGGALLCRGNYLYATLKGKLCIYDVSAPLKPRLLAEVPARGNRQFALAGDTLYLSCRHQGVQVFDVSDQRNPKEINHFFPAELATGLTVAGKVLGVTERIYGVEFFDVTDPRKPRSMGRLKTGEAQSAVFFGQGKIAVGDWGSGKAVIGDVTDPAAPRVLSVNALSGMGDGVTVRDHYLFAATGNKIFRGKTNGHGLEIFDIADPKKPVKLSQVVFPLDKKAIPDWWQVVVCGNTAFVADSVNGVYLIDFTDLKSPKIQDHLMLPGDAASQIALGEGVLYISGHQSGLYLLPCAPARETLPPRATVKPVPPRPAPSVPGLAAIAVPGFVWRLTKAGDTLYASCGDAGLREYRINSDGSLTPGKVYPQSCFDCQIDGDLVYMARGDHLEIFDRRSGKSLSKTPAAAAWSPFFQLHLYPPGLLISTGRTNALLFWDVSDPRKPRLLRWISEYSLLYDDMLPERAIGGLFPVNWHSRAPIWYSTAKPTDPAVMKLEKLNRVSNQGCGIAAGKDKFYFFANRDKVFLLDPKKPEQFSGLTVPHRGGIPTIDGELLALSNRSTGSVALYRIDGDALAALPGRTYQLPMAVPGRAVFHRGKIYLPAGNCGIYREK